MRKEDDGGYKTTTSYDELEGDQKRKTELQKGMRLRMQKCVITDAKCCKLPKKIKASRKPLRYFEVCDWIIDAWASVRGKQAGILQFPNVP